MNIQVQRNSVLYEGRICKDKHYTSFFDKFASFTQKILHYLQIIVWKRDNTLPGLLKSF